MTYREFINCVGIGQRCHIVYLQIEPGGYVATDIRGRLRTVECIGEDHVAWLDVGIPHAGDRPCLLSRVEAAQAEPVELDPC